VPNGDASAAMGGFPPVVDILEGPEVPGTGIPSGPVGTFIESVVSFFGGLFGGGGPQLNIQTAEQAVARREAAIAAQDQPIIPRVSGIFGLPPSAFSGRFPIPLPEQGGPALVTERFQTLPPIPDVPELVEGPLGFEGITDMPVDVPLLTSSFLPAVRGATTPAITGFLGGIAQDLVQGFFRPVQELGLGQVPARQPATQVSQVGCPPEKPHTRILRFIKMNTGVSIKLSRAKSLIRELGLENAARCLGVNVSEACSLLIVASPRRRRGISASDIRIVKRTARRFENLKHDLGHLSSRTGHHHHRRRTSRHK